jgi:hypothetical protein
MSTWPRQSTLAPTLQLICSLPLTPETNKQTNNNNNNNTRLRELTRIMKTFRIVAVLAIIIVVGGRVFGQVRRIDEQSMCHIDLVYSKHE